LTRNNTQERGNRNKIKKGTRLREREKEGVTSFFFSLGLAYFEEIKGWALIGPFGIHLSLSLHLHPMAQCNPFRFSRSGIIFLFFSTLFEKRL
jgi:hypothetical protein